MARASTGVWHKPNARRAQKSLYFYSMDVGTIVATVILFSAAALFYYAFAKYFGNATPEQAQKINDIQFGKTDVAFMVPPTDEEAPPKQIIVDPKTLSRPDAIEWRAK